MERAMITHPAILWRIDTYRDSATAKRYGTKVGPLNQSVPLAQSQHHVINPTNPCGALDDGVEDWLHICGRAADDAKHLSRCRLMLQRLTQLCIALLQLFE